MGLCKRCNKKDILSCTTNRNGKHHSISDNPAIVFKDKIKWWFKNGKLHRKNGPAIITEGGHKAWKENDQFHRLDGPAVIFSDGQKSWYINNIQYSEQEWKRIVEKKKRKKSTASSAFEKNNNLLFALMLGLAVVLGLWLR